MPAEYSIWEEAGSSVSQEMTAWYLTVSPAPVEVTSDWTLSIFGAWVSDWVVKEPVGLVAELPNLSLERALKE